MSPEEKKTTFTWIIENYSLCYLKNKESLLSPVFTAESLGGSKWYLRFCPKGDFGECQDTSLYLYRSDDISTEEISIRFIFDIACSDRTILLSKNSTTYRKFKKNGALGSRNLIKSEKILQKMKNLQDKTLIIRCHLSSEKGNSAGSEYEAKTRIGEKKCLLNWNVPLSNRKDFSEQKKVSFQETSHYEVVLTATNDDHLSAKVKKIEEKSALSRVIELKVSLLGIDGTEVASTTDDHLFDSGATSEVWEFSLQSTIEHLEKSDNNCVQNGIFSLLLEFSASNGIELESVVYPKSETFSNVDNLLSLRSDLQSLFLKKDFYDVTLKAKGKSFPAHRSILSARSKVFYAMFTGGMVEQKTGVVELSVVEENILQSFLKFIYTGTVNDMEYDSATKLLIIADKYNVQSLVETCACFLISNLAIENAAEVFSISDMVNHKFLKATALEFIASNRKQVLHTPKWMELIKENITLSNEIYAYLVLN